MTDVAAQVPVESVAHQWLRRGGIFALLTVIGLSWALASAPGSSPDDDYHLSSIWCAWGEEASGCAIVPADGTPNRPTVRVPALSDAYSQCVPFKSDKSAACQYDPATPPSRFTANRGGYPYGFYATLRVFASDDAGLSIIVMRTFVFLVSCGLLGWAGLLLTGVGRFRLWLAWISGSVPLAMFVFASTNPSATTIAGVAATSVATWAVFTTSGRRQRSAVVLALVAPLAAVMSRPDAPFLLVVAVAAGMVLSGQFWRRPPITLAVPIGVIVIAIAGFLTTGGFGASVANEGIGDDAGTSPTLLSSILKLPSYFVGPEAAIVGYLDVASPALVWATAGFALAGLLLMGLGSMNPAKAIALIGSLGATAILLLVIQQRTSCCQVQPRYMTPLVFVIIAVAIIAPAGTSQWRMTRTQSMVIAAMLGIANCAALFVVLVRYTIGLSPANLDLLLSQWQWWWGGVPFAPRVAWLGGSLAFALLTGLVAWRAAGPDSDREEPHQAAITPVDVGPTTNTTDHQTITTDQG